MGVTTTSSSDRRTKWNDELTDSYFPLFRHVIQPQNIKIHVNNFPRDQNNRFVWHLSHTLDNMSSNCSSC